MGPRIAALALVLATGCSAVFGLESPGHQLADAADAPVSVDDGNDACISYSTLVDTCTLTYGSVDVELPIGATFNTDTGAFVPSVNITTTEVMTPTGPAALIAMNSITVKQFGSFRVMGSKPLIVAARNMIVVDGTVDISSGGAGARACNTGVGQSDDGGGSGGAGASFAGSGGSGGDGDSDGAMSSTGATANFPIARPAGPLGGCRGGDGGIAKLTAGGNGGAGGGAIAIVAARIEIGGTGQINANGQGGRGGRHDDSGGGGGGSGGFILLESPTIIIDGKLAANGGGGGEGAGANDGNDGATGTLSTLRASGGAGGANQAGDGGQGGAGATPNGTTPTDFLPGGGGGGGGGVGFISMTGSPTILSGAVISPPHSTWVQ